jgi:hypothetical protein
VRCIHVEISDLKWLVEGKQAYGIWEMEMGIWDSGLCILAERDGKGSWKGSTFLSKLRTAQRWRFDIGSKSQVPEKGRKRGKGSRLDFEIPRGQHRDGVWDAGHCTTT